MSNAGSAPWLGLSIIVAWVVALGAGAAGAQPAYHVSVSKVDEGSWKWTAIYSDGGAGPLVHSVVAILDPAVVNDDNLQVVWYIRGDPWTSQTWTTTDPWEAINSIKSQLGIPNAEDERWEMGAPSSEDQAEAQDYANGFLASDPLGPAVWSMPDPEAWIEDLVSLGYPAANLSADNAAECLSSEVLDGLAGEFEDMIGDGDETVLDLRGSGLDCLILAAPPRINPRPGKPPAGTEPSWSPPGTIPTAPAGWTPGGWTGWSCRTVRLPGGGNNCICTRWRRWGRWELDSRGRVRWHEIWERETCTDILQPGTPCAAPPPGAPGWNCTSTYTVQG